MFGFGYKVLEILGWAAVSETSPVKKLFGNYEELRTSGRCHESIDP